MILLDSVYINDGGGLVLLKHLVDVLIKQNKDVYYLFDERTYNVFKDLDIRKSFISNNISARKKFYKEHSKKISSVLCFGNVPPPIKLNVPTLVYFHQPLFLKIPNDFSLRNKLIYKIKQIVLRYFKDNANLWIVQSKLIQEEFAKKYCNGSKSLVRIIPFYPSLEFTGLSVERCKNTFLYVSNTAPHKNHENLIAAFCNAYDQTKKGLLVITVPSTNTNLCQLINYKIKKGYPIKNVGFVDRQNLIKLYLSSEYLIFPSLAESFGLGLAEAIDGGCKVIAADLPYTYQVCNPSLTFNPYSIDSIESAIIKSVSQELPESNKIITNDINQLILLLSE